ncbi:MAG: hypothetical protein ABW166_05325 [Sedimenticola sp.]
MSTMPSRWLFLTLLLLLTLSDLAAGQNKRSRHLHDLYCRSCHSSTIYLLDERKMASPGALVTQVLSYGRDGKVKLSESELRGIAEYLRTAYYGF